tara:strand:+ start:9662 stop:10003 length:342 start_codon:yes stop_codon:yes gene_type:complete
MSKTTKLPIDVYFYVDPDTRAISGVFAYHPLGISIRSQNDWQFVRRANTELDTFLATHEAYVLDWDTDYVPLSETNDDEPLEEHKAIRMYDSGELNIDNLTDYAKLVYDPEEE